MSISEQINDYARQVRGRKGRVGVFAVGFNHYWPQFPNLKAKLEKHFRHFYKRLKKESNAEIIVHEELSDCYETALKAGVHLSGERLDLLICYIATYAPSIGAGVVLQKVKNVPFLLVCMKPSSGMDYAQATTEIQLENDSITSLPEMSYTRSPAACSDRPETDIDGIPAEGLGKMETARG